MPTYDYRCDECLKEFETQASISRYEAYLKDHNPPCPHCGSTKTARVISPVHFASPKTVGVRRAGGAGCCPGGGCV